MSILTIEHLTHRFGEKVLYEEASLQVNKGDHLGNWPKWCRQIHLN